ncbi:MAG TPA: hypothetical protein VMI75_09255 [Polyangiaceae bacterium]|nr:hypothetical protein [Polyangiaceae bacterium]
MKDRSRGTFGLGLLLLVAGCSSSSGPSGPTLSFTSVHAWDGGADAGCTIGTGVTHVGCSTAYSVSGNPYACQGFDDAGVGSANTCKVVCGSAALVCSIAGLSNGTNAVDCQSNCASPEH